MGVVEIHGFPGSGKTTILTMIAQRLLQGKKTLGLVPTDKVYTSFPCPNCYKINPDDFGKYAICSATILIDEISLYFDNRQFQKFTTEYLYFWKLHRHFHLNIVYCSQGANDADLKIRTLVDETYIVESFFQFSVLKPIMKRHDVVNGRPEQVFELAPPLYWSFVYRPKWYKYFDSFEVKPLPPPIDELWDCQQIPVKSAGFKLLANIKKAVKKILKRR